MHPDYRRGLVEKTYEGAVYVKMETLGLNKGGRVRNLFNTMPY